MPNVNSAIKSAPNHRALVDVRIVDAKAVFWTIFQLSMLFVCWNMALQIYVRVKVLSSNIMIWQVLSSLRRCSFEAARNGF